MISKEFRIRVYSWRYPATSAICTLLIVLKAQVAQAQLFNPLQSAIRCITTAAGNAANANNILNQLPGVLTNLVTVVLMIYIVVTAGQAFIAFRQGEELTQVLQQPMAASVLLVILVIFQNVLFGNGAACQTG